MLHTVIRHIIFGTSKRVWVSHGSFNNQCFFASLSSLVILSEREIVGSHIKPLGVPSKGSVKATNQGPDGILDNPTIIKIIGVN